MFFDGQGRIGQLSWLHTGRHRTCLGKLMASKISWQINSRGFKPDLWYLCWNCWLLGRTCRCCQRKAFRQGPGLSNSSISRVLVHFSIDYVKSKNSSYFILQNEYKCFINNSSRTRVIDSFIEPEKKVLIIEIFGSVLGLFGLIIAIILSSGAEWGDTSA